MAWPHEGATWRDRKAQARTALRRLAIEISHFEPVRILVHPADLPEVREFACERIQAVPLAPNDAWARDTLPNFLRNGDGQIAALCWKFNGWGDPQFAEFQNDITLAQRLTGHLNIAGFHAPLVNEGGAVLNDGDGTLWATRATILNENRNPGMAAHHVERILCESLGAEKVLWLDEGYDQDETGGHIDVIAALAGPAKILHLECKDSRDPNHRVFQDNIRCLRGMADARGRPLEVICVPQPARREAAGRRLSLSYLNFYLPNGGVLLPVFNDPLDDVVVELFERIFPGRVVVPFAAEDLFYGGGGIHCVTQQQPLAVHQAGSLPG